MKANREIGWRALLTVGCCLLLAGAAPRKAERPPEVWETLEPVNALGPIAPNGSWTRDGETRVGTGTAAPWSIQVAGDATWTDYRLTAEVVIRKPTPKADFPIFSGEFDRYLPREDFPPLCQHTGQYRYRYYAGEFDWGSDAALFVRYQDRENCYRVQLSTRYQELILWHGTGGYLQVVPCELKPGKAYRVDVVTRGDRIRVRLDGRKMIDYRHRTLPTLSGKIGLGVYQATAAFTGVRVTPLPPAVAPAPPHKAVFTLRRWRTLAWIFDGNEPICLVEPNPTPEHIVKNAKNQLYFHFVKLVPGYRPYYFVKRGVWPGNSVQHTALVGTVDDIQLSGEGTSTLGMRFTTADVDKVARVKHDDRLSFDAVRGTYRWDMNTVVEFLVDRKMNSLEFYDPLTYNNKFPGRGVRNRWLPAGHKWGVVSGTDGKLYRHPLTQALNLWGQNSWGSGVGKGFWMLYPDRAACPVWEYEVPGERLLAEVCHWGYDFHQRIRWGGKLKQYKAGDRVRIRHVATAYPPREAEKLFLAAPLHDQHANPRRFHEQPFAKLPRLYKNSVPDEFAFPVCDPAGNDFTRLFSVRQFYVGWQYRGLYKVDRTVGHNDRYSMRVEGPAEAYGEFYHHMIDPVQKYRCTLWLKTKGVTGAAPVVRLKYAYRDTPCDAVDTGLTGDNDWVKISFVTTVPCARNDSYDSTRIDLVHKGKGTVWMDDFSVRPLAEGETIADELPPSATLTRRAAPASVRFWDK